MIYVVIAYNSPTAPESLSNCHYKLPLEKLPFRVLISLSFPSHTTKIIFKTLVTTSEISPCQIIKDL